MSKSDDKARGGLAFDSPISFRFISLGLFFKGVRVERKIGEVIGRVKGMRAGRVGCRVLSDVVALRIKASRTPGKWS